MARKRLATARSTSQDRDKRGYNPEDYNAVTQSARLATISLLDCKFVVKPGFFKDREEGEPRHKFVYGHELEEPRYVPKRGLATGQFTWKVEVRVSRKKVLNLVATYLIVYENLEDMNAGAVSAFVERVGRYATYPYFRSLASQLSWESGAQLPVMPVISSTR